MKIAYIVNARIPTEKAHGYQISKMCGEFARSGAEVILFAPKRHNPIKEDAFSYYSLERNFKIEQVRCFDAVRLSKWIGGLGFAIQTRLFLRALRGIQLEKDTIIYTRNPEIAEVYYKKGHRVFYDAHNFPEKNPEALIGRLSGVSGVICNSSGTAEEFRKNGFKKVLVAHNGVDIREFDISLDKTAARSKLGLLQDARVVTYVGHLYAWKGIDSVMDAASKLSKVTFLIVGGTEKDIERYARLIADEGMRNIVLAGHKHRKEIPMYLKASDLVLLPNAPVSMESERYTSPIKMFEYMASLTPIIASDLSSIREVLDEKTASFFEAGNPAALSKAIEQAFESMDEARERAKTARDIVERYSWQGRARAILDFIKG
jgi:glycosyltransferase involved in cell wall biosynthesis